MSPSCQTSSTDGTAASTASRAGRLAWISESTATRTRGRVAEAARSERTPAPLRRLAREADVDRTVAWDDDETMLLQAGHAAAQDLRPAGAQRPERTRGRC